MIPVLLLFESFVVFAKDEVCVFKKMAQLVFCFELTYLTFFIRQIYKCFHFSYTVCNARIQSLIKNVKHANFTIRNDLYI